MVQKKVKRIAAMVLASLMMLAAFASIMPLFVSAAEEDTIKYPISDYNPGEDCPDPIPLLVIMINFDADGDGVDDNPNGSDEDVKKVKTKMIDDKPNPVFGEQWCHTTEEDWTSRLFSFEGNTLNTYYKYMSNDKFYWVPTEETYGVENNGVIAVAIKNVHPNCIEGSGQWVHCYKQIVEAASEFVDFSKYDKNGNGKIEKYELCFAFILGGAETSSGATNNKEVFGFHAYYKDYDTNNVVTTDGVEIGRSGFFGTGAISGGKALNFGVFAHELGHYLGAPDLYDTSGSTYDQAVGAASMMASGSHGTTPAHFDPYMLSRFGFYAPTSITQDGTYTVYSKASSEGEYNIIKLCTPNPNEYYLIENRYSSIRDGSTFDNGISQGILIWHIDETIHKKGGNTCNAASHGYDPAVVVYAPIKQAGATGNVLSMYSSFRANHPTYENYAVFKPSAYTFPKSKTWYTGMTDAEAKQVENLCVEILSEPGDEMQIKVTGSYNLVLLPEISMFAYDWTKTSVTIKGELETLNNATMTSATFTLTEKETGNVVKEQPLNFASDYTYEILCDGLKVGTAYEYKIVAETSHGQLVISESNYTKPEEVKQATVTIVVNSDNYKTTTQKVNVGKELTIRFPLTKYGYTFDGWYLDEAYTQPYTPGVIDKEEDFTIYAKWAKNAPVVTTPPATVVTTAPATDAPDVNVATGCGGITAGEANNVKGNTMMLFGGIAAAIIADVSAKKRKK